MINQKHIATLAQPKIIQKKDEHDYQAPDGSKIFFVLPKASDHGDMAICVLPADSISIAVKHRTVHEYWYIASGKGEIWLKTGDIEQIKPLVADTVLSLPKGTSFQFRNTGDGDLKIAMTTMPCWPGADEAIEVKGKWEPRISATPPKSQL